jgi:transcriptional regulator with GAF, ATPase, and Fis domain
VEANRELQREVAELRRMQTGLQWELRSSKALAELSHALITLPATIRDVADVVLHYARKLTNSESGFVASIDPDTRDCVSHTLTKMTDRQCTLGGEDRRSVLPVGADGRYPGLWGHVLNTRRSFYTNSPRRQETARGVPEGHILLENFLSVPALFGTELVGQIALANSRRGYTDRDVEAIERVAELYGVALHRYRLEEALRVSERSLKVMNEIANVFLTFEENTAYGEVLRVILGAVDCDYGLFGYLGEDRALVCCQARGGSGEACQILDGEVVFEPETFEGAWGAALREKRTICSNEASSGPGGRTPLARAVFVPLVHGGEALGLMVVGNRASDFGARELEMLSRAAGGIAPILSARLQTIRDSRKRKQAEDASSRLRGQLKGERSFAGIVGGHPTMVALFDTIREIARLDVPVLIQGESGTGKELVATALHSEGPRSDKPFIPVNCSSLPQGLLESELYGHVRGAFTGATRDKKGRFELAHGGTIFLDEVGDLSPAAQVSLLRVLQEKTVERIGAEEGRKIDVRVVSATNKNLRRLAAAGKFREDLFYRICVFPVDLAPLRERREDIPLLAAHILTQALERGGQKGVILSGEAVDALMAHEWPGNVRELQNAVLHALVKCSEGVLKIEHFPPSISAAHRMALRNTKKGRKRKLTGATVKRALEETQNKSQAARNLGVSRATLYKYLESVEPRS